LIGNWDFGHFSLSTMLAKGKKLRNPIIMNPINPINIIKVISLVLNVAKHISHFQYIPFHSLCSIETFKNEILMSHHHWCCDVKCPIKLAFPSQPCIRISGVKFGDHLLRRKSLCQKYLPMVFWFLACGPMCVCGNGPSGTSEV
jgi:hypothetical protein